jgi:hypothetical protein
MRLQGEWQLEKIEVNGENIGYKYNDSLAPLTFKDFKFWFVFDYKLESTSGNKKQTADLLVINKSSKNCADAIDNVEVTGFDIYPKKDKLMGFGIPKKAFPINDIISSLILKNILFVYWEIMSLHNKQLIIERKISSGILRLCFKKTRNN